MNAGKGRKKRTIRLKTSNEHVIIIKMIVKKEGRWRMINAHVVMKMQ